MNPPEVRSATEHHCELHNGDEDITEDDFVLLCVDSSSTVVQEVSEEVMDKSDRTKQTENLRSSGPPPPRHCESKSICDRIYPGDVDSNCPAQGLQNSQQNGRAFLCRDGHDLTEVYLDQHPQNSRTGGLHSGKRESVVICSDEDGDSVDGDLFISYSRAKQTCLSQSKTAASARRTKQSPSGSLVHRDASSASRTTSLSPSEVSNVERTSSTSLRGERTHSVTHFDCAVVYGVRSESSYTRSDRSHGVFIDERSALGKNKPHHHRRHSATQPPRRCRSTRAAASDEVKDGSRSRSTSSGEIGQGREAADNTRLEGRNVPPVDTEVGERPSSHANYEAASLVQIHSMSEHHLEVFSPVVSSEDVYCEISSSQHRQPHPGTVPTEHGHQGASGNKPCDDAVVTSALSDLIGGLDSQIRALCRNLESLSAVRDKRAPEADDAGKGTPEVKHTAAIDDGSCGVERIASLEEERFFDCISSDQELGETQTSPRSFASESTVSPTASPPQPLPVPALSTACTTDQPTSGKEKNTQSPGLASKEETPTFQKTEAAVNPLHGTAGTHEEEKPAVNRPEQKRPKAETARCASAVNNAATTAKLPQTTKIPRERPHPQPPCKRGSASLSQICRRSGNFQSQSTASSSASIDRRLVLRNKLLAKDGGSRSLPALLSVNTSTVTVAAQDDTANVIEICTENCLKSSNADRTELTAALDDDDDRNATEFAEDGARSVDGIAGRGQGGCLGARELSQMVEQWGVLWTMWANHKTRLKDILTAREREAARTARLNEALSRSRQVIASLRQQRHDLHEHLQTKEQEFSTTLRCHRNETAFLRKKVLTFLDEKKTALAEVSDTKSGNRLAGLLDSLLSVHVHRERYLALDLAKQNKINELKLLVVRQQLAIEELKEHNSDLNHALGTLMQFLPDQGSGGAHRPNLPRTASSAYPSSSTSASGSGVSGGAGAGRRGLGLSDVLQCERSMYLPHHSTSPDLVAVTVYGIGGEHCTTTTNFQPGEIFDASRQRCHADRGDHHSHIISTNTCSNNLTATTDSGTSLDSPADAPTAGYDDDNSISSTTSGDTTLAEQLLRELNLYGPGTPNFSLADVDR